MCIAELEQADGRTNGQNLCPWFVIVFPWDELDGMDGMNEMGGTCTDQLASWWLSFLFFSYFFSDLDWFLEGMDGGRTRSHKVRAGGEVGGKGGGGGIITIRYSRRE